MKNKILITIIFILLLASVSCANKASVSSESVEEAPKDLVDKEPEIIEKSKEPEQPEEIKVISPLDGLKYYPEELSKRTVAVSIDNHPRARWQAGLSQAELIYEFEVEYPYTRYLCIFLAKEPELVGPVRSARPYIIYYALENGGIFVHVGGSEEAFSEIRRLMVADVDGLYSGAMFRYYDTEKYAPHNMYTTLKSIRDEASSYGYSTENNFEGYTFNEDSKKLSSDYSDAKVAESIEIIYNKSNTTSYTYDAEQRFYLRFKDGEKHVDELDNMQLTAKNIIAIETSRTVLDSAGRLDLGTIGEGRGLYITQGESIPITWEKQSEKDRTRFYSENNEIKLNPGNTWIQVVSDLDNVSVVAKEN
ncbi:MAG: DUF3048 domain-containing protein [Sedimentibacter sp.]